MSEVPLYNLAPGVVSWFVLTRPLPRPGLYYRGISLIRNSAPLGPYSRTIPRVLGGSHGVGALMGEVPL